MKTTFLATSPLHVLIAIIIASNNENSEQQLIICGRHKKRNTILYRLISQWRDNPFFEVINLKKSRRPWHFKQALKSFNPQVVLAGNDLTKQFYSVAALSKKLGYSMEYMDDGLHSYIEYSKELPHPLLHAFQSLFIRLLKGYTKPYPHTLGSSPITKKAHLFFPELAKLTIRDKECKKIVISEHTIELLQDLASYAVESLGIEMPDPKRKVALYTLPHHTRITSETLSSFSASMQRSLMKGYQVVIKNHPSNEDSLIKFFRKAVEGEQFLILPKILPIEIFIFLTHPILVCGGLSSIFLTTKALNAESSLEIHMSDEEAENIPLSLQGLLNRRQSDEY